MRTRKVFWWSLGGAIALLVIAAAVVYIQLSRIPANYKPARLTSAQKAQTVKDFWVKVQEFGNAAQKNEAFVWQVSQEELNRFLASMDEIAASTPYGKNGQVCDALEQSGLAEPAIALDDGTATLMVRSVEHNKIASANISFGFAGTGKLRLRLAGVRIGRQMLPDRWVEDQLGSLQKLLPPNVQGADEPGVSASARGLAGLSAEDITSLLETLLTAVDSEPISTELTWPVNDKKVRIDAIEIEAGLLRLHVVPVGRGGKGRQSSQSR